ncbi:MAG: hypothetical protein DI555_04395 [Novosphingobium pentaromativorans]|uniref:DUF4139 domain-containing protein n=1 Tax=Novosphingobium pentaromativorans TaxID=205844 RepID=A0A2W5NT31_9SPHN|nr:hypothetical protein [Novosphingobium panipatense]PZQ56596.1 MAG: hypothetical protein DI555_04395 [Novosphingobium pentaromativorans]
MVRRPFLALALLLSAPVAAPALAAPEQADQQAPEPDRNERVVVSRGPERVSLTLYRAPYGRGSLDLRYLGGFALVTETRRIRLPRGRSTLRFEGVAEGIVPVSAVIEGLPGGTIEKNRDARLLSPASLVDGTLGRLVTVTRRDKATGRTVSEEATVIAGPQQGVVLQTRTGFEALGCSGLPERLVYDSVPAGLSDKPVLSVVTQSAGSRSVTVRLSYLSSGFDWRASYVATQADPGAPAGAAAGGALELFAWLTLANSNGQSFADTEVSAVAGRLNRRESPAFRAAVEALRLSCYPLGTTTSDLRERQPEREEIVVTASARFRGAPPPLAIAPAPAAPPPPPPPPPPEDLGDLKLYRVPERVTVSARGQKQVALLSRAQVPFERRYRRAVYPAQMLDAAPSAIVLVMRNKADTGLGLALPAGSTALYAARADGGRQLLGLGAMKDRADGETFRIAAGTSGQVTISQRVSRQVSEKGVAGGEAVLTVTNANPFAVPVDIPIGTAGQDITADDAALERVDGIATWSPTLPPGGAAQLRYRFTN